MYVRRVRVQGDPRWVGVCLTRVTDKRLCQGRFCVRPEEGYVRSLGLPHQPWLEALQERDHFRASLRGRYGDDRIKPR